MRNVGYPKFFLKSCQYLHGNFFNNNMGLRKHLYAPQIEICHFYALSFGKYMENLFGVPSTAILCYM